MKKSTQSNTVSPILQKLFVGSALLVLVAQVVQTLYFMSLQYTSNQNFSAYSWWFTGIGIIAVMALGIYFSRRQRGLSLRTMFDVSIVVMSFLMIAMSVSWLTVLMQLSPFGRDGSLNLAVDLAIYVAPFVVAVPVIVVVIRRLRAAKQW
jgi:hypothetical protein